jgi:transposase-like protein
MSKRRKFSAQFKADLVMSVLTRVKTQAEVCREHQLKPQLLGRWRTRLMENAYLVFQTDEQRSAEAGRIAELEQILGRKTLELEVAKKASTRLNSTTMRNGSW